MTACIVKRRKGSSGGFGIFSRERDFLKGERHSSLQPALRPPVPQPAKSRGPSHVLGNIIWPEGLKQKEAAAGLVRSDNYVLLEPSDQPRVRLSLFYVITISLNYLLNLSFVSLSR